MVKTKAREWFSTSFSGNKSSAPFYLIQQSKEKTNDFSPYTWGLVLISRGDGLLKLTSISHRNEFKLNSHVELIIHQIRFIKCLQRHELGKPMADIRFFTKPTRIYKEKKKNNVLLCITVLFKVREEKRMRRDVFNISTYKVSQHDLG